MIDGAAHRECLWLVVGPGGYLFGTFEALCHAVYYARCYTRSRNVRCVVVRRQ